MKQRLYADTSVFGGYYDREFSDFTQPFLDRIISGQFILLFSPITEEELDGAPNYVKDIVKQIPRATTEFLEVSDEATELAVSYQREKVVGRTSYADCMHIALATINHADFLVSWNFKHIVNIERIRGYNSVNIKMGYKELDIRTPREFIDYGNKG